FNPFFFFLLLLLPIAVFADCTCEDSDAGAIYDRSLALKYKIAAIVSILVASLIGVCLPTLGTRVPALSPDKNFFFVVKSFAAGVILATGFIHVLPDAFSDLTSPCLDQNPWGFPFAGLIAMTAAILSLMIDSYATAYYKRRNSDVKNNDVEAAAEVAVSGLLHGHAHGGAVFSEPELLRHRVISQVLELGIIVHSVIIGIALGASQDPLTIKPLIAALTFHQLFEGMGLGGCISQGKFKARTVATMAAFFATTTPGGIAIGIAITKAYRETSPTALIVQGTLNSASAGILIYMALVDLLGVDFMSDRLQGNGKLMFVANLALLFGAGCMALLAKWA
ncbi:zinc transporter protein, partial [Genlisea aurea]